MKRVNLNFEQKLRKPFTPVNRRAIDRLRVERSRSTASDAERDYHTGQCAASVRPVNAAIVGLFQ